MPSRGLALALVALLAATLSAGGQGAKPKSALIVVQAPGGGGSVSISFVQIGAVLIQGAAGQATLDLGQVSYLGGSSQPGVTTRPLPGVLEVSTDFGIQVDRKGSAVKTASVSAFLLAGGTTTVSIDGVQLLSTTQVISPNAAFGVVVPHTLTIGVPTTSPAGPLSINVGVMAIVN